MLCPLPTDTDVHAMVFVLFPDKIKSFYLSVVLLCLSLAIVETKLFCSYCGMVCASPPEKKWYGMNTFV